MYKIVETVEKGARQLTVVPQAWEKNGSLFWPKMRAEKLIKIGSSVPEDSWFQMECKLKRNHLLTYTIAEEELSRMLEKDETEADEPPEMPLPKKKRVRVMLPKTNQDNDFNDIANVCMMSEPILQSSTAVIDSVQSYQIIENETLQPKSSSMSQNIIYLSSDAGSNTNPTIVEQYDSPVGAEILSTDSLNEKLANILQNQEIILGNQNTIIENVSENVQKVASMEQNQLAILQQLAKFEAMIDTIIAGNLSNAKKTCSCEKTATVTNEKDIDDILEPIETLEDLVAFENKLSNKDVMEEFVKKFSYICGKKGDGHGINNCYTLVDRFFSRKFLTYCSWAGGARGEKEKIPFKIYKNVLALFFKVIHLSDQYFTFKDCEDFLKSVIRNSTRRSQSNMTRTSKIKKRPKNLLSYKVKTTIQMENGKDQTEEGTEEGTRVEERSSERRECSREDHEVQEVHCEDLNGCLGSPDDTSDDN